jgi:lysophospholipase L1-like esterase
MCPRSRGRAAAAATALLGGGVLLAACHNGGGSPTGPSTPPPVPTYSVTATVFYDENGNGILDPAEAARVPNVTVTIGTGTGTSAPGTGQAVVTGIQEGSFSPQVRTESLPYYYVPPTGALPAVTVPGATDVRIPLTLPIGSNRTSVYFGYGDSITAGEGSSDGQGYALRLQNLLGPHFARAQVEKFGRPGTNSADGASRIRTWLRTYRAAYVLILYGTNDWQDQTCQNKGPDACFTIASLDSMIADARDFETLPVVATIIPVNPAVAPSGREAWVEDMNARIKALAQQQQVLLADLNAEMKAGSSSLSSLFSDDVHPNDAGYQVLAQGWFKAISRSRSASASARRFGFRRP